MNRRGLLAFVLLGVTCGIGSTLVTINPEENATQVVPTAPTPAPVRAPVPQTTTPRAQARLFAEVETVESMTLAAFEEIIYTSVEAVDGWHVLAVDCDESPCIAVLASDYDDNGMPPFPELFPHGAYIHSSADHVVVAPLDLSMGPQDFMEIDERMADLAISVE